MSRYADFFIEKPSFPELRSNIFMMQPFGLASAKCVIWGVAPNPIQETFYKKFPENPQKFWKNGWFYPRCSWEEGWSPAPKEYRHEPEGWSTHPRGIDTNRREIDTRQGRSTHAKEDRHDPKGEEYAPNLVAFSVLRGYFPKDILPYQGTLVKGVYQKRKFIPAFWKETAASAPTPFKRRSRSSAFTI